MDLQNSFTHQTNTDIPRLHRPPLNVNFAPQAWKAPNIIDVTGPYAYVLNLPQIGECKPGFLFDKPRMDQTKGSFPSFLPETPEELDKRLRLDGLNYLGDSMATHGHIIAFFKKEGVGGNPSEILYLRRDSNNRWSYREITEKGGCSKPYLPKQIDFSGEIIKDPRQANLGNFKELLGFASIPYKGVLYYKRVNLSDQIMKPFFKSVPAEVKLEI